jgi:hypothetical protein
MRFRGLFGYDQDLVEEPGNPAPPYSRQKSLFQTILIACTNAPSFFKLNVEFLCEKNPAVSETLFLGKTAKL